VLQVDLSLYTRRARNVTPPDGRAWVLYVSMPDNTGCWYDTTSLRDGGAPLYSCAQCPRMRIRGGGTLLKCARCRSAYYCSAACQLVHWPTHKHTCHAAPAALA
jgi:hypothetical protein